MKIVQLTGKKLVPQFHEVTQTIFKNDPSYTPLFRPMVENIFNPQKNNKFKKGDACRWLVKKERKSVGRIAAFFDSDYYEGYNQPTGCIGFFECINDKEAAFLLFDTAKKWLQEKGMEAMD